MLGLYKRQSRAEAGGGEKEPKNRTQKQSKSQKRNRA